MPTQPIDLHGSRETLAQALRIVQEMPEGFLQGGVRGHIARVQAWMGDVVNAHQTAAMIQYAGTQVGALCPIAEAEARAGDRTSSRATLTRAITAARGMDKPFRHASTLCEIAAAQAQTGDLASCRETLTESLQAVPAIPENKAPDLTLRVFALRDIARVQVEIGDLAASRDTLAQAIQTTRRIEPGLSRGYECWMIARVQARAGDFADSRETLSQCLAGSDPEDTYTRNFMQMELARLQNRIGDIPGALAAAEKIPFPQSKAIVLREIAEAQAERGEMDGCQATLARALSTALHLGDSRSRTYQLARIAVVQSQTGDAAGSRKTLANARRTALGGRGTILHASALGDLARIWTEIGDMTASADMLTEAIVVARRIPSAVSRNSIFQIIARDQAKAGDVTGAVRVLGDIPEGKSKDRTRVEIADALALAGDVVAAQETAVHIQDIGRRASALIHIAERQCGRAREQREEDYLMG